MERENDSINLIAYEDCEPFDQVRPEKNLLFAVLLSAMNDLKKEGEAHRKATEFFLSGEDDYIFSFRSICDYLSIDPHRILYITGLKEHKRPLSER